MRGNDNIIQELGLMQDITVSLVPRPLLAPTEERSGDIRSCSLVL